MFVKLESAQSICSSTARATCVEVHKLCTWNAQNKIYYKIYMLQIAIMFNKILWWVSKATKRYTQLFYLLCKVEDHGQALDMENEHQLINKM